MTREDIIRMALEAGATSPITATIMLADESVIRFAALVAAASEAREREACIQVIKKTQFSNWFQADCIEAIRARGQA